MKLLKMLTPPIKATVIALMASAAFGDIYVAVNDPNAGDTPVEGRGMEELPYKTLQAAMQHDGGLASGTTVWVKPGTYAEGGAEADNNSNRVVVAAGVIVRATGTAEETIIQGASDPDTLNTINEQKHELKGIGPKAVRCAYLNTGAVLRGFTLKGGRCRADNDTCGYEGRHDHRLHRDGQPRPTRRRALVRNGHPLSHQERQQHDLFRIVCNQRFVLQLRLPLLVGQL